MWWIGQTTQLYGHWVGWNVCQDLKEGVGGCLYAIRRTQCCHFLPPGVRQSLVAYGSGKRMVTGTRAGSRIKTRNFKRRFLPHHKSQRRNIWCTNSPVISCFSPKFVDRSVPYEANQRRVKFRRCFGNIPLAEYYVSVMNVRSSRTEPKAPVTDYRNRGSGNHTRG